MTALIKEPTLSVAANADTDIAALKNIRQKLLLETITGGAVKIVSGTYWEELLAVGYNPKNQRLEAMVKIKQANGYSDELGLISSYEYVRFFIDYNNTGVFTDAGLASFKIADNTKSAGDEPVNYMVCLTLDDADHRRLAQTPVLPRVKAILSWNSIPPSDPDFEPMFGNSEMAHIQLSPLTIKFPGMKLSHLPDIIKNSELNPLQVPLTLVQLKDAYKNEGVPATRFAYKAVEPMLFAGEADGRYVSAKDAQVAQTLGIDLKETAASILKSATKGHSDFEELVSVGYNAFTNTLGAIIKVKRPSGYNGSLTGTGSMEYVSFWLSLKNDGNFDYYAGTARVQVHDIDSIPGEGLYYCVSLPIGEALKLSAEAEQAVGLRAVLSWHIPPSSTNPAEMNYWGDSLNTCIEFGTDGQNDGKPCGRLFDIGGVSVDNIDPVSHYAFAGRPSANSNLAFGGLIRVGGAISNSGAAGSIHFRVEFSLADEENWQPATYRQSFNMEHLSDAEHPIHSITIESADGWMPYMNCWDAGNIIVEQSNLLAMWDSASRCGTYKVRMAYTTDIVNHDEKHIKYTPAFYIIINNKDFQHSHLTTFGRKETDTTATIDIVTEKGGCASVKKGEVLTGYVRVHHPHFGTWTLTLEPAESENNTNTVPTPSLRSCTSLHDYGDENMEWTIDTTTMAPCGYTLTLRATDRTIVNGSLNHRHQTARSVGFAVLP